MHKAGLRALGAGEAVTAALVLLGEALACKAGAVLSQQDVWSGMKRDRGSADLLSSRIHICSQ